MSCRPLPHQQEVLTSSIMLCWLRRPAALPDMEVDVLVAEVEAKNQFFATKMCCAGCAGLRFMPDAEVDALVAEIEAEKAAAEAARRGPAAGS